MICIKENMCKTMFSSIFSIDEIYGIFYFRFDDQIYIVKNFLNTKVLYGKKKLSLVLSMPREMLNKFSHIIKSYASIKVYLYCNKCLVILTEIKANISTLFNTSVRNSRYLSGSPLD